ncbi:MAG TPA: CHASE2 domain-containing protein [Gammaproteobacteria bacterium]|nr:CHASE2 domain-containing protein [Gammaproteobacteria bacterium]
MLSINRTIYPNSFLERLTRRKLADLLAGNIVLIGTSAVGLGDPRAIPLNPYVPGVAVHCTGS